MNEFIQSMAAIGLTALQFDLVRTDRPDGSARGAFYVEYNGTSIWNVYLTDGGQPCSRDFWDLRIGPTVVDNLIAMNGLTP